MHYVFLVCVNCLKCFSASLLFLVHLLLSLCSCCCYCWFCILSLFPYVVPPYASYTHFLSFFHILCILGAFLLPFCFFMSVHAYFFICLFPCLSLFVFLSILSVILYLLMLLLCFIHCSVFSVLFLVSSSNKSSTHKLLQSCITHHSHSILAGLLPVLVFNLLFLFRGF